ncbi:MAG: MFS transporter [Verrucomicrobia bacterium]|nr:MFS transporter [Verrucomicrobiota bacterium]
MTAGDQTPQGRRTRFRWTICALVFLAVTINYIDRLVFGILAPELQKVFRWTNADYTRIAFWFEVAYAIGLACFGRVLDWIGTRRGFALSLTGWSLAAAAHALMSTIAGFSLARFLLGLTEAGVFPAATKTAAEWFPRRERALVMGIFNAGSNVGAVIAPLLVPWLFLTYGWRWTFIVTGGIGLIWLVFWLWLYRAPGAHPRVSPEELAYIHSDPPEAVAERIPWLTLLRLRQTWAFITAKFFTDAVWRWYLYLLPLFFNQNFQLDIRNFGLPFITIYLMADVGSVGGGWLSSWLLGRGWSVNAARKFAMLVCALCVLPVMFSAVVPNMWVAVVFVGLAASAHQGFSSNLFTTVSDMFPKSAVGSVVGLGGTAGALGAMLLLTITARLFDQSSAATANTSVYTTLFVIAGFAYLVSLGAMHVLSPRLQPVLPEDLQRR